MRQHRTGNIDFFACQCIGNLLRGAIDGCQLLGNSLFLLIAHGRQHAFQDCVEQRDFFSLVAIRTAYKKLGDMFNKLVPFFRSAVLRETNEVVDHVILIHTQSRECR